MQSEMSGRASQQVELFARGRAHKGVCCREQEGKLPRPGNAGSEKWGFLCEEEHNGKIATKQAQCGTPGLGIIWTERQPRGRDTLEVGSLHRCVMSAAGL